MKLTFRVKLMLGYVALVAVAEILTVVALDRSLSAELTTQLARRLEDQAKGSAEWVAAGRHPSVVAGRLSHIASARVTLIDKDGAVLGDSGPDAPDDASATPEVAAVRAGRIGRDVRKNPHLDEEVLYVAVPAPEGIVVRLAAPLSDVNSTLSLLRQRLLLVSAVVFVLAVLLALVAARLLALPLVAMRDAARGIAQGDYDVHLPPGPQDEFGDLSRSLRSLADQLDARIGEIVSQRNRLQTVLASMIEGVVVLDAERKVELANPSAERLLGRGALAGRSLDDIVVVPALRALFDSAGAEGAAAEVEDGERVLAATVQPLSDGGAVCVLHDVTAPRRMEAMRRQFIGDISHEIGTPVSAIQGYAETLMSKKQLDPAITTEFLEIIHRHARRIGNLVADLRFLSALEGRVPDAHEAREPVSLRELAHHVSETVRPRAEERKTSVSIDIDDDVVALGDTDHVERVLLNLVDNAVKYGRAGGTITVRGRKKGGRVVVEVTDDGPGIPADHIDRVFDRFYRVDRGRSRAVGGTGLGLAIVKQLAEAMGGSAAVTSELGKGARFVVELPAVDMANA